MNGAQLWVQKMGEAHVVPYKASFLHLIESAASLGSMDAAEQWTQEMVQNRMHPDRSIFEKLKEAAANSEEMGSSTIRPEHVAWACGVIILAYVHVGAYEFAQIWHDAEEGLEYYRPFFKNLMSAGQGTRRAPRTFEVREAFADTGHGAGLNRLPTDYFDSTESRFPHDAEIPTQTRMSAHFSDDAPCIATYASLRQEPEAIWYDDANQADIPHGVIGTIRSQHPGAYTITMSF